MRLILKERTGTYENFVSADSEDKENLARNGVTHILSVHNNAKPVLEVSVLGARGWGGEGACVPLLTSAFEIPVPCTVRVTRGHCSPVQSHQDCCRRGKGHTHGRRSCTHVEAISVHLQIVFAACTCPLAPRPFLSLRLLFLPHALFSRIGWGCNPSAYWCLSGHRSQIQIGASLTGTH